MRIRRNINDGWIARIDRAQPGVIILSRIEASSRVTHLGTDPGGLIPARIIETMIHATGANRLARAIALCGEENHRPAIRIDLDIGHPRNIGAAACKNFGEVPRAKFSVRAGGERAKWFALARVNCSAPNESMI